MTPVTAASNVVPGASLPGTLVRAASNIAPGASLPDTAAPAILGCKPPRGGVNGGCATERWSELPVVINIARYERVVRAVSRVQERRVGQTSLRNGAMLAELSARGTARRLWLLSFTLTLLNFFRRSSANADAAIKEQCAQ